MALRTLARIRCSSPSSRSSISRAYSSAPRRTSSASCRARFRTSRAWSSACSRTLSSLNMRSTRSWACETRRLDSVCACARIFSRSWLIRRDCLISSGTVVRIRSRTSSASRSSIMTLLVSAIRLPELITASRRSTSMRMSMVSPPWTGCCRTGGETLPQPARDRLRHHGADVPGVFGYLFDDAGAEKHVVGAGEKADGLESRKHFSVGRRLLKLEFEVGYPTQPSHHDGGVELVHEVNQEAIKRLHLHIVDPSQRLLHHPHAFLQ